jgi:hypothetical protein
MCRSRGIDRAGGFDRSRRGAAEGPKAEGQTGRSRELPVLGTHLPDLPPGPLKTLADQACLTCHSGDMLRQQRLNEKQWAAEVDKMVGWGSDVPQDRRQALIAYLVANFGPANDTFRPVVTRPVGR